MMWLRMTLFLVSTLGYVCFFEEHFKFKTRLSWIAVFCMNVLVVYVGGLLGRLLLFSLGTFALGVFLFAYGIANDGKKIAVRFFKPDFVKVLMGFYLILFVLTLLQTNLVHFDNFSHWGLIVKFLVTQLRFPEAADTLISFSAYPLGSSLFVYYFTLIVGYGEGVMLVGQFIFILAGLYALFGVIRDDRRILVPTVLFTILTIMNHFNVAIRHNNLLVDFILPVLALSSMAGTYVYRDDIKAMSLHSALTLGVLIIVKSSALFFVAIAFAYYLYSVLRYHKKWQSILYVIMTLAAVSLPLIIWKVRMDLVFADVASKHQVDVNAYRDTFAVKTPQIIQRLWELYIKASFDINSLAFQGVILVNVMFLVLWIVMKKILKKPMHGALTLLSVNALFIIYYMGIFLMFLFSMPLEEAMALAGFERYASSIVIFALGIFGMVSVVSIDRMFYVQDLAIRNQKGFKTVFNKTLYQYATVLLLFFSITLLLSENNGMRYNNTQNINALPEQLKAVVGDRMDYNDDKVLLVASDETGDISTYYAQFVGRYYLFTNNVEAYPTYEMDNDAFIEILKQYDYVVMPNKNYTFIEKIRQTTGMVMDQSVYETETFIQSLK